MPIDKRLFEINSALKRPKGQQMANAHLCSFEELFTTTVGFLSFLRSAIPFSSVPLQWAKVRLLE